VFAVCAAAGATKLAQSSPNVAPAISKIRFPFIGLSADGFHNQTAKVCGGFRERLRPPALEYDLVGPAAGSCAFVLTAHSPCQQRQSENLASEQGRRCR